MNSRYQKICAWAGPLYILALLPAWYLMGFLPPPGPSLSAADVAAHYRDHNGLMLLGGSLTVQLSALGVLWTAALSAQIRRIEQNQTAPILSYAQLACGTVTFLVFIFPAAAWVAGAFRPDRSPEEIMVLNDWGWLTLFMTAGPIQCQSLAIAAAVLSDRSATPIFPRWAGYLNIWAAVLYFPAWVTPFFHSGPFAWNGVFVFWLPLTVFTIWVFVMSFLMHKAINAQKLAR